MHNCQQQSIELHAILDTMVTYYGALVFEDAITELRSQFNMQGTYPEILEQILMALEDCQQAVKQAYYLSHKRVSNPGVLLDALNKANKETYAKLPKEALMAFKGGLIPSFSIHHDQFKRVIAERYGVDAIASQLILTDIMLQMNLDWSQNQVLDRLPEAIRPANERDKKEMVRLLALVYQHTPRWLEKGFTPNELYVPQDEMMRPQI